MKDTLNQKKWLSIDNKTKKKNYNKTTPSPSITFVVQELNKEIYVLQRGISRESKVEKSLMQMIFAKARKTKSIISRVYLDKQDFVNVKYYVVTISTNQQD